MANWLNISQTQLSRIESGRPINDLGRLIQWAQRLRIPPELLWFSLPDDMAPDGSRISSAMIDSTPRHSGEPSIDFLLNPRRAEWLTISSPAHLQEILVHLGEQWHALVRTDNLLGPRFALAGVLNQISVIEALRSILRDEQRIEATRLGAKYAESAAWLYEDIDDMTHARFWVSQAMEWAYEGDDERMLAWTMFRRAQQAAAISDAAQTIGLAQAARRNEEKLATPTRAAIRVQEAYGYALDGNDQAAQRLLDEAHTWAAGDNVGDAREGHGSYCTPGFIEIQRGHCWLASGHPKKAISVYEDSLHKLPAVYQRNRTATLTRLAVAYAADSQPEQAANIAHVALPAARSAGSNRIVGEIRNIGTELIPYRALPAVAVLLDDLKAEDHLHDEPIEIRFDSYLSLRIR